MRPKNKQLSEKYKATRLTVDIFYGTRLIQTFFNKFIKQGKRATARKHLYRALRFYRSVVWHRRLYFCFLSTFYSMRIQFLLVPKRQASIYISVPTPVRRNKRDVINLQTIYKAISDRRERFLDERVQTELLTLTLSPRLSTTLRARSAHLWKVVDECAHMERRWK